ncbi:MAG: AgmX/PglI C-terminal domain-containing protein, partial [Acetobacteraceae bacterium]
QGSGAAAKDTSGAMGSTVATRTNGRFAQQGRADNPSPQISREQLREEVARFGMIGLLQAQTGGDSRGPTAAWGADAAEGRDAFSANGNMWGASIDDSAGAGGLGLHGIGIGGGGVGESIGVGKVATVFGGAGNCKDGNCSGIGLSHGNVTGDHKAVTPVVRVSNAQVSGRLPADVIQRIVRQNFGRFRLCYEGGLRGNPNLAGRVAVRFVIDRSGAVTSTSNGGSDLPDSAVVSCVVRSFSGLSFPAPENGIVSVVYPISFAPGS